MEMQDEAPEEESHFSDDERLSGSEEQGDISSQQSSYQMAEWRQMTERECEIQLEKNPTDNEARFRLAEIYVTEEKKLDIA